MAKIKVTQVTTPIFNMVLTEAEAKYLYDLTQNYLGDHPNDETDEVYTLRSDLWLSLNEALSNG
jgi:hypothetical protein